MALVTNKVDLVNKILAENIHENIRAGLLEKVKAMIEPEIEKIVHETVDDLVSRIESYNNMDGSINVKVEFMNRG